jgi:hypothetical protein
MSHICIFMHRHQEQRPNHSRASHFMCCWQAAIRYATSGYVDRSQLERLALTSAGQVRYALKTPYRDGTTHIVLEPLDLLARLAALVPPPRMHLTRFHGVFAPHSKLRAAVTPGHRGVGSKADQADPDEPATPRHVAMTWAQHLKRVFGIQIDLCARCGGKLRNLST